MPNPTTQAPEIGATTTNDEVAALFQRRLDLHAVAVVENGRPVALINRQEFMNEYARLYFREVHGRRSAIDFANRSPRIVELDHDVEELHEAKMAASGMAVLSTFAGRIPADVAPV